MPSRSFELLVKTPDGKRSTVVWDGEDGPDAAQRYAAGHPGCAVVAWRVEPHGFFPAVNIRRVLP